MKFVLLLINRSIVSVEQGSSQNVQTTPNNSPAKVYTSLNVVTPQTSKVTEEVDIPNTPTLQINEEVAGEPPSGHTSTEPPEVTSQGNPSQKGDLASRSNSPPFVNVTPTKAMNEPMTTFPQGVLDDFITQGNSQIHSLQFEQYVFPSEDGATGFTTGQIPETTVSLSIYIITAVSSFVTLFSSFWSNVL